HRLGRMDEHGIWAQVLYPNLLGFEAASFMELEHNVATACVHAYNEFIMEFASCDRRRLVPVLMLPLWDLEASRRELDDGIAAGFRAMLFGGHLERVGLPSIGDPHWNPLLARAQEAGVSVNFHVGFSSDSKEDQLSTRFNADARNRVALYDQHRF